jgi:chemotaxis protein methyltransferase CheR
VNRPVTQAAALLHRHAGFKLDTPNAARLDRVLREAAESNGQDVDRYVAELAPGSATLADLIDRVTVQETAFFRHAEHFEVLARDILPRLQEPITIWSAACANGQEAYSLAMVLEESRHEHWTVVATDISNAALDRARDGGYEERELRGLSPERRRRHFVRRGTGLALRPELARRVSFARHNLALEPPPFAHGRAQVVFCRNVLIYLAGDVAALVLERLHDHLPPAGHLFIGASESLWHLSSRFTPQRLRHGYVHRPAELPAEPAARAVTAAPARPARRVMLPTLAALVGEGERAAAVGDHLEAANAFRRAGYLDPTSVHATLSLGLALEAAGDARGARRAYRSAQRELTSSGAGGLEGYGPEALDRLLVAKLEEAGP